MAKNDQVIVMQSFTSDRSQANPYVGLLVDNYPADVMCEYFSWRMGLLGKFDLFHVHWPEALLVGRSRVRRIGKRVLLIVLLTRCLLLKRPIVRTVHNVIPHETSGSRVDYMLYGLINKMTKSSICMNGSNSALGKSRRYQIPHGHYRDILSAEIERSVVSGRVVYFGQIREYKGVERLVDQFSKMENPRLSLDVIGSIADPRLANRIETAAYNDERVCLRFGYVSDLELEAALRRAELVVLPYTRMNNSGAMLYALSVGVPVVVPRCDAAEELSAEVGSTWVRIYDGPFESTTLESNIEDLPMLSSYPEFPPQREWSWIASRTADVYMTTLKQGAHR